MEHKSIDTNSSFDLFHLEHSEHATRNISIDINFQEVHNFSFQCIIQFDDTIYLIWFFGF